MFLLMSIKLNVVVQLLTMALVRMLEEVLICVLSSNFSTKASRLDGLTGVWVDFTPFNWTVPCGVRDRQIESIMAFLEDGEHRKVFTKGIRWFSSFELRSK